MRYARFPLDVYSGFVWLRGLRSAAIDAKENPPGGVIRANVIGKPGEFQTS
jgi:hypothetical protein